MKYGRMTQQNFKEALANSVFVDQATPDIRKYFKDHVPGWQGGNLQKNLGVAVFAYDEREEFLLL